MEIRLNSPIHERELCRYVWSRDLFIHSSAHGGWKATSRQKSRGEGHVNLGSPKPIRIPPLTELPYGGWGPWGTAHSAEAGSECGGDLDVSIVSAFQLGQKSEPLRRRPEMPRSVRYRVQTDGSKLIL